MWFYNCIDTYLLIRGASKTHRTNDAFLFNLLHFARYKTPFFFSNMHLWDNHVFISILLQRSITLSKWKFHTKSIWCLSQKGKQPNDILRVINMWYVSEQELKELNLVSYMKHLLADLHRDCYLHMICNYCKQAHNLSISLYNTACEFICKIGISIMEDPLFWQPIRFEFQLYMKILCQ